ETRLAIVVCDACMIGRDVLDAAKEQVTAKTGLPANRMLISATHSHAVPRVTHIGTGPLDDEYHEQLARKIAEAVILAEKNLAPAKIGFGSFNRPDLIRCRRFLCEPGSVGVNPFGEAGERIKSVSGKSSAVIEPAGPVDPQISILSVRHADGKPLAALANFSVHYCGGYKREIVSADYFYAQEALHLSKYLPTERIKLQAIRLGDIGIAAAPCEVFAETGLAVKKQSPLARTFTIELANGYGGYLPPAEQHELGGYETWPARSSFLEVEAEAKIRTELLSLLAQVASASSFREVQALPAP
ncbi:MAG TPA: hypothetical protein VMM76_28530, partial [Pirellulaceae bacterium]|nr:hypothetical protein [Pirellulaceae bacterium]